jgi:hypothetical protein
MTEAAACFETLVTIYQTLQKTAVVMLSLVGTSNLTFILRCLHHNVGLNYFTLSFPIAFSNRNAVAAVAIRNLNLKEALYFYPKDKATSSFESLITIC